jgi:hypothetical protein
MTSGGERTDEYHFELMNTGPAAARDVRAWAESEDGVVVASADLHTLPADNSWQPVRLDIPRAPSDAGGLTLCASWRDESGLHKERLLPIKRLR